MCQNVSDWSIMLRFDSLKFEHDTMLFKFHVIKKPKFQDALL